MQQRPIRLLIIFAFFLLIGFILAFAYKPNIAMLPGLVLPALVLFMIFNVYFSIRRNWASDKSLKQNLQYTFSNDGVDLVAPSSSAHTAWENFSNVYETKHNFLLFVSQSQTFTIPKRVFRDAEQIATFKQMLVLNLGSKAKLKK
jgi:YcxB-like protein